MNHALAAAGAVLSLLVSQGMAQAEPILYTEATTASGTLGGKTFNDLPLLVYYLGDTSTVSNPAPGIIEETGGVAGFRLAEDEKDAGMFTGGGAATLFFPAENILVIGANSTNPHLNPTAGPGGGASGVVLGVGSPALAGYTLQTAIGPVMGPGIIQSNPLSGSNGVGATFTSTAGKLFLTKVGTVKLTVKLFNDPNEAANDIANK